MNVNLEEITETLLTIERAINGRWNNGDCYGFLETYSEDMTYFDPRTDKLLDGRKAVEEHFRSFYKGVGIARSEYLNPQVIVSDGGELAVLSYNLRNFVSDEAGGDKLFSAWNSTEVYRLIDGKWRIVNSHWSRTRDSAAMQGPGD